MNVHKEIVSMKSIESFCSLITYVRYLSHVFQGGAAVGRLCRNPASNRSNIVSFFFQEHEDIPAKLLSMRRVPHPFIEDKPGIWDAFGRFAE